MLRIFIVLSLFFFITNAFPIDYSYNVGLESSSGDNITQNADQIDGVSNTASLGFTISNEPGSVFAINSQGSISYTRFSVDELDNETDKEFQLTSIYQPKDYNFTLLSLVNLSQVPRFRFRSETVNNTRESTILGLRPNYFIRFDGSNRLNFSVTGIDFNIDRVEDQQFTLQDTSSDVVVYSIYHDFRLNSANQFSLVAEKRLTDYEESIQGNANDYEQNNIFARWVYTGTTDAFQLEYGESKVENEANNELKIPHGSFSYERRINRRSTLALDYSEGYDRFIQVNLATNSISFNTQNSDIAQVQKLKSSGIRYNYTSTFWNFSLNGNQSKLETVFSNLRQDRVKTLGLNISYSMSRLLNTPLQSNLEFGHSKNKTQFRGNDFAVNAFEVDETYLQFNHFFTRNLRASLGYNHRSADQDSSNTSSRFVADGDSIYLSVNYQATNNN